MAKGGPSPLIPLLLVVVLGLLLRGNSFPAILDLPLVSEAENAIFASIVFIPFLVLLALYSATHSIVLPLALVFITYTVTTMLLAPLMLILVLYLAMTCLPSFKTSNGEELGWGCVLVLAFVLLHWISSDEARQSAALLFAVLIFLYFQFGY